jgi:hypothetical protein
MDTNTLVNHVEGGHSEFYSNERENYMASYTITLTNKTDDLICFGYLNNRYIMNITSRPADHHY